MIGKEELKRMYWRKGLSIAQIAEILNISHSTIHRWMKSHNIPRRTRKCNISKEELKKLYQEKGLSTYQIAEKLGKSQGGVCYLMKKYNILRRNKSEACKVSHSGQFKKGYISPRRVKFTFNGLNEDLAYILGVRFGDGWINNTAFHLNVKDKEFAEEVYNILNKLNLKPHFYKHKLNHYHVTTYSTEFCNWLSKIDIDWLKENLTNWELQKVFIRGFYDSDGCLTKSKEGYYRLRIVNTNKELINFVYFILQNNDFHPKLYIRYIKGNKRYCSGRWFISKKNMLYICLTRQQQTKRFCQEIGSSIPRKEKILWE